MAVAETGVGRGPSGGRRACQGRPGPPEGRRWAGGTKPRPAGRGPGSLPIGLLRLAKGEFELIHPKKVDETREDYEEGMELWKEGDPESARDVAR